MNDLKNDIVLLQRLRKGLDSYLDILKHQPEYYDDSDAVFSEIHGQFIDEEQINKHANHAYIYMAIAYLESIKHLPKQDFYERAALLDGTFGILLDNHYNVSEHASVAAPNGEEG